MVGVHRSHVYSSISIQPIAGKNICIPHSPSTSAQASSYYSILGKENSLDLFYRPVIWRLSAFILKTTAADVRIFRYLRINPERYMYPVIERRQVYTVEVGKSADHPIKANMALLKRRPSLNQVKTSDRGSRCGASRFN